MPVTEQRLTALQRANEIRFANSKTTKRIAALPTALGAREVADILDAPDEYAQALPIGRLLKSIRMVRHTKVEKLLRAVQVTSADRRVRELTLRQRSGIAMRLRGMG